MSKLEFRQGDVGLDVVAELPNGTTRVDDPVIAYGEATGHRHRLVGDAQVYRHTPKWTTPSTYIVVGTGGATIVHEEHAAIQLPPKTVLRYVAQREFHPTWHGRTVLD